jgi:cytochrome c-type biogenesis protein CcmE
MLRRRRFIIGGLIILAALFYIVYGGMQEAIVYFVTPSELKATESASADKFWRMGGMVVAGSLQKDVKSLTYRFELTDGNASFPVFFRGVPPDLFTEGKGAVVEGRIGADGVFQATTIMAKHAEEYSPHLDGKDGYQNSFVPGKESAQPCPLLSPSHFAALVLDSALTGLAAMTVPPLAKTLAVSPNLSFSRAAFVVLESVVRFTSLSFVFTVSLPAFASTEVTLPVRTVACSCSDFISGFFSVAGGAGVAGVAGFACAKLRPLKVKLAEAITKTLMMFFTASPPSLLLDEIFSKMLEPKYPVF